MHCPSCGKKIPAFSKFCPACGKSHSANVKEGKPRRSLGRQFLSCLGYLALVFLILTLIFFVFFFFGVWGSRLGNYQKSAEVLPLFQDSLAEASAAKIMGDSIIIGHPTSGASFTKVKNSAETIAKRLSDLTVPSQLDDYKRVAVNWSNAIAASAKDTKTWKDLPSQPADFQLTLNDGKAKEWLKTSIQNIQILKEFGDTAIKNKDREAMRYIAARLLVQQHWVNGILHSKDAGFLSFNLVSPALASSANPLEVPPIGPAGPVPCWQVCTWVVEGKRNATDKLYLWNMYRCDYCGQTAQPQQQQQNQPQQPAQQNQPAAATSPGSTPAAGTAPLTRPEVPSTATGEFQYGPGIRNVCLSITGVAGAYCAQAVAESTWEIEASAIGFTAAQEGATEAWDGAWHNAEAMGGISVGEPVIGITEHSPRVQAFYDSCGARGGIVGGSGQAMARVPTTEGGYRCEYKQNGNSCWDLLTYSGGRYMGGNSGCPEENLVPVAPAEEAIPTTAAPAPTKKTAPATTDKTAPTPVPTPKPTPTPTTNIWDGTYSVSCVMGCHDDSCIFTGGGCISQPDISQKFNFNIQVQNDAVISSADPDHQLGYIGPDGKAGTYVIMFPNNSGGYLDSRFSSSGGKAVVSGNLDGGWEEGQALWVCSCDFSGSRVSN